MTLKISLFLVFLGLYPLVAHSQDLIFMKKDSTIERAKILEVGIDIIKFKKYEIPKGPTFEIPKSDVIKIVYANGYTDIYDTTYKKTIKYKMFQKPDNDTSKFSMIYVLFYYGNDESARFPLSFNGKSICLLRNHMRLAYKIYSEGQLLIERKDGKKIGPSIKMIIQHGVNYGIYITIPNEYALDPNKKFAFKLALDVNTFLHKDYFGFDAFSSEELMLVEDRKNPVIIY